MHHNLCATQRPGILSIPGLTLALVAQVAVAAQPPVPTPTPVAAPPAKPKIICRSYRVVGSLIARQKVCHTAAEWNRVRDTMNGELNRVTGPLPGGGDPG